MISMFISRLLCGGWRISKGLSQLSCVCEDEPDMGYLSRSVVRTDKWNNSPTLALHCFSIFLRSLPLHIEVWYEHTTAS